MEARFRELLEEAWDAREDVVNSLCSQGEDWIKAVGEALGKTGPFTVKVVVEVEVEGMDKDDVESYIEEGSFKFTSNDYDELNVDIISTEVVHG